MGSLKRNLSLLILVIVIVSALPGVKANPSIPQVYSLITIASPHEVLEKDSVNLLFYVDTDCTPIDSFTFFYIIDGLPRVTVNNMTITSQEVYNPAQNPTIYKTNLTRSSRISNLPVGFHNIIIYQIAEWGDIYSTSAQFEVKSPPTPNPTPTETPLLSPRNPPHAELLDYLLPIAVILTVILTLSVLFYRWRKKNP